MDHIGKALKTRAIHHIVAAMHTIPACAPDGLGEKLEIISQVAGFEFHNNHTRQFSRGLLLEAVELGLVKPLPWGKMRHRYALTEKQHPPRSKTYLIRLKREGVAIITDCMDLYCDYVREHGPEFVLSSDVEKGTGLYESKSIQSQVGEKEVSHRGYWAWHIREELIYRGILTRGEKVGNCITIKLAS